MDIQRGLDACAILDVPPIYTGQVGQMPTDTIKHSPSRQSIGDSLSHMPQQSITAFLPQEPKGCVTVRCPNGQTGYYVNDVARALAQRIKGL